MSRPRIPRAIEIEVLILSRRRCCFCFGLEGDFSLKRGQLAHLDRNPSNNSSSNLAFMCLDHHNEYDSRSSQSKGLSEREATVYREALYTAAAQYLQERGAIADRDSIQPDSPVEEDILLASGELEFYVDRYSSHLSESTAILAQAKGIIGGLSTQMSEWGEEATRLADQRLGRPAYERQLKQVGAGLAQFAEQLRFNTDRFSVVTGAMLNSLTKAAVLASDFEGTDIGLVQSKLTELQEIRPLLEGTAQSATGARDAIRAWPRSTTGFNRGKRLAVAAIDAWASAARKKAEEVLNKEAELSRIMELY